MKSFGKILSSSDPKIALCGTPIIILSQGLKGLLTFTRCFQFFKYLLIHINTVLDNPYPSNFAVNE